MATPVCPAVILMTALLHVYGNMISKSLRVQKGFLSQTYRKRKAVKGEIKGGGREQAQTDCRDESTDRSHQDSLTMDQQTQRSFSAHPANTGRGMAPLLR